MRRNGNCVYCDCGRDVLIGSGTLIHDSKHSPNRRHKAGSSMKRGHGRMTMNPFYIKMAQVRIKWATRDGPSTNTIRKFVKGEEERNLEKSGGSAGLGLGRANCDLTWAPSGGDLAEGTMEKDGWYVRRNSDQHKFGPSQLVPG